MSTEMDPIVGNWYQYVAKGLNFEVVAVDEETVSVEIQYVDGTLDEISLEDWYEIELEPAEPPDDWAGSLDADDDTEPVEPEADEADADDWDEPSATRPGRGRRAGRDEDPPEELGGDWDE